MKGYKAFDRNLCCKGFQYEIGKTYEIDGEPIICTRGFHFCKTIAETYNYYPKYETTRICEVEALGNIVTDGNFKFCTNKIRVVSEITESWIKRGNVSMGSTGYCNTGHWNTGHHNTSNYNTGNRNTGDWNTGHHNVGHWNTGNYNTGNHNTGDWNTGHQNTGDWNTGDWNTGHYNTGNHNTGHWNAGAWNTGNWNCGIFNTNKNPTIKIFNKESSWTFNDWQKSVARRILDRMPMDCIEWIGENEMTDDEKEQNPSYSVIGGYLKKSKADKTPQEWWDSLHENYKNEVMSLPNFDAETFYECTGIEV